MAASCSRISSRSPPRSGIVYHPPGWDIVLPVGISFYTFATLVLHARRLPPSLGAGRKLPQLRIVRDLLPASGRGADHAPDRACPAVRGAAPRKLEPDLLRPRAADARAVPEGRSRRRLPLAGRRGGLRRARQAPRHARQLGRDLCLRGPDLLRFRRLFDLRDRGRLVPRLRHARQFPLSLRRRRLLRFLAPLAHHLIELASRLSLHSVGREPARRRRAPTWR